MLLYIGEKNVLAFRSSVMEELEAVKNYLLCGAYLSGLSKGEKANLRRKCKNNFSTTKEWSRMVRAKNRGGY